MPQFHTVKSCVAALCLLLWAGAAWSATWEAEAIFTVERTTDVDAVGATHEDRFDQAYALSYETSLLPYLDFTLDFTLDVEETTEDPGFTTRDTTPAVDATLMAQWWELFAGWEETKTTDTDPAVGATVESNWEFEAIVVPEYQAIPAFRFNIQGGNDDVLDRSLEMNFEYSFLDTVDLTFDALRETSDVPEPDEDTEDRKYTTDIAITHLFTKAIAFEADWVNEREQNLQLSDQGEILTREDTLNNELRGLLEWNILDMMLLSIENDVQWDKDLEQDTLEFTDTWIGDFEYDYSLTEAFHLNLGYTDEREDARPVGPDTYTITKDYTAALEFIPFDWLAITPSYDRSDKIQWSTDSEAETEQTVDEVYEVALDYALWGDFMELAVTRTWDFTREQGVRTKEDYAWDVDVAFLPIFIPRLEVAPQYTFTRDDDLIANTTDDEETIDVDIDYEISLNDVLVLGVAHTYSRTQSWPSDASMSIERADDTDLVLQWNEFLRGMNAELSWTRAASDTSGDDKGPEIDHTYSALFDWEVLNNYFFGIEYNHDVKQESEDTRDVTTTLSAEFYDGRIILDFEHEFDEQLEGERKQTHRYLIELSGQF